MTARLVVLVSGEGTNLQALLDASADPAYGARVVAVGADRDGIMGVKRAEAAGIPTFVVRLADCADRDEFDRRTADAIAEHQPDLLVLAGYLKLLSGRIVGRWRTVNTHPALLPSFPGAHGVRDALAHGVKVTGCSVILVDEGVDSGPIVAQAAVDVLTDDDESSLHGRIKTVERALLVDTVGRLVRDGCRIDGRKVTLL
ncbi:MAG TPA: phosphoribosylglycinamide formyltransferase [Mycobacteriales bacterium]|nr:phosphoribosylglycinamide formyltransferase [Mycobacteriales bacterium]